MAPQIAGQRRLQRHAESRRAILDAAERLLVEGGLETFSMRRLAERCGCSAPSLYHYFPDKPGLVSTLLEERLRELVTELRQLEFGDDAVANVRTLCAAFADFALRNPDHYQLLAMSPGPDTPEPPSNEEARGLLVAPLEELVRRGDIQEGDFEVLRQGLWSLLHGFVLLQTSRPDEPWVPDLLDRSVGALIEGLLRRGSRDARLESAS